MSGAYLSVPDVLYPFKSRHHFTLVSCHCDSIAPSVRGILILYFTYYAYTTPVGPAAAQDHHFLAKQVCVHLHHWRGCVTIEEPPTRGKESMLPV